MPRASSRQRGYETTVSCSTCGEATLTVSGRERDDSAIAYRAYRQLQGSLQTIWSIVKNAHAGQMADRQAHIAAGSLLPKLDGCVALVDS
jgi:hypothetical protein